MHGQQRRAAGAVALAAVMVWAAPAAQAVSVSGTVRNRSEWPNLWPRPGDGLGTGSLVVGVWPSEGRVIGVAPLASATVVSGSLPLPAGPYPFLAGGALGDADYAVMAWIDGNANGLPDAGEPHSLVEPATIAGGIPASGILLTVADDGDEDGVPDWWEAYWFYTLDDVLGEGGDGDPDNDGLTTLQEYTIATTVPGMEGLSPTDWDTDDDGMDDKWEYDHYSTAYGLGLDPTTNNATWDTDGDGLSDYQEYCGIDGEPLMLFDRIADGIEVGRRTVRAADDLNPLDIDTDFDLLLDSFEAAWYDPTNRVDPRSGPTTGIPSSPSGVDTSIAREDSDQDGLSNYREQCLLLDLREGEGNGDKWDWECRVPFPFLDYFTDDLQHVRMCFMDFSGAPLDLGLNMALPIPAATNRAALRDHDWTDPTDGTGYIYTDEDIPPGHDTDDDGLPDGWETQFNLDPRDPGWPASWDNGPFGDPDNDGLFNWDEYTGQDGDRFTTKPYVNGTGDESNPWDYDHRPDSTYRWRWYPSNAPLSEITDPRPGAGINRSETLGAAPPTASVGKDRGTDSDDDGLPDAVEIHPELGTEPLASSPVHACDPYRPKCVRITSPDGVAVPDPEPAVAEGMVPAGVREDLQRRDWTIECQVKLLGSGLSGDLFRFVTRLGATSRIVYRLALSNDVPILSAHNSDGVLYTLSANRLPTNRWIHLAGVWNHARSSLGLYVHGVLYQGRSVFGESASRWLYPATNALALAASPDGSFVNRLLLDEVRIWGIARDSGAIAEYARRLVPPGCGDDVWVNLQSGQYYEHADSLLVNGGSLFYGEPGTVLSNVCSSGGNYWIDDGDHQFNAARDTLLRGDGALVEGLAGQPVANVFYSDKDGSGGFSRNSLLACYRFDDGGRTAEDFARRAKNGLMGAASEEFLFGDHGYALPTNNVLWVTNDAAPVFGCDRFGADDADGDGMPDAWELIHRLDPYDDGTGDETAPGAKDGPYGPEGDPDHDGLRNLAEFWAATSPQAADSDGDGILDTEEDRDGDGVANVTEQQLGSRPDMVDTDDDGLADNEEQGAGTSPADAADPAVSRALQFGGAAVDFMEIPTAFEQRLTDWTLEAWVRPASAPQGVGTILRRVVQSLAGGTNAVNYCMGLDTHGTGGLRLYAGYVLTDGRAYLLRGGTLPTGTWTHVAASYNSLFATLTLYVNGTAVGATNAFYEAPPVNGRGGEVFVRAGEDLAGRLDELRVWSIVRTPAQIQASYRQTLAGEATNGLVHDFRCDDGEATTNRFRFGGYHQPHGIQDFMHRRDWNEQWRHAALLRGDVRVVAPGALVPPPSLRVILVPEEARQAGAQWALDGGAWQNSGDTLYNLSTGAHTLAYRSVTGWTAPPGETVSLTNGVAHTLTRTYAQTASLKIELEPQAARDAGAQWRVDGGAWQNSGATVENLPAGTHSVDYRPISGWIPPPPENVTLSAGQARSLTREYSVMAGGIAAVILPVAARSAGAHWRLDGGPWLHSGDRVTNLSLSTHLVDYQRLDWWKTPGSQALTLSNQALVTVTGVYEQLTGIHVDITPSQVVTAGARWSLDSAAWTTNSGVFVETAVGVHTVRFTSVSGWLTPGQVAAIVSNQLTTFVTGTYYNFVVYGGTIGTAPGQFNRPSSVALDHNHKLYVADTYNNRIQVLDPHTGTWTVWGSYGTNQPGRFNKPYGVAVDSQGNLYVADSGNNRVQRRLAYNGQWTAWGGYGTTVGSFIGPMDVTVDMYRNLYVADLYNDRVQKRNTNGVWSVFISAGGSDGHVLDPRGLVASSSNRLYVADDGTSGGRSRVQRFTLTGAFIAPVLGSVSPDQAGLRRPGGLAINADGSALYVADTDNSRIMALRLPQRTWRQVVGGGVFSGPQDVAWSPLGRLYVADTGNHRVLMITLGDGSGELPTGAAAVTAQPDPVAGGVVITWQGRQGWLYAVQHADQVTGSPVWKDVSGGVNLVGSNGLMRCRDTTAGGVPLRFYRVQAY